MSEKLFRDIAFLIALGLTAACAIASMGTCTIGALTFHLPVFGMDGDNAGDRGLLCILSLGFFTCALLLWSVPDSEDKC